MSNKKLLFEHLGDNSFQIAAPAAMGMMAEKRRTPEEINDIWEDDKSGEYIQINADDSIFYVAHGKAMEQIAPKGTDSTTGFRMIRNRSKMNQMSYNIWQVNDHGNVELFSQAGRPLGGLV